MCAEDHHHNDSKSITWAECADCKGPHAASFFRCSQYKAAFQYQHDIIYGHTQQHDAPEPNMYSMKRAWPSRPQTPLRQDPLLTYVQGARGQRKQEQSVETSKSQQEVRKESQEGPQEKGNHLVSIPQSKSTLRSVSVTQPDNSSVSKAHLLLPMLISPSKAMLAAIAQVDSLLRSKPPSRCNW